MQNFDVNLRTIDRGGVNYIQRTINSLKKDNTFYNYKINIFDSGSKSLNFLDFLKDEKNIKIFTEEKRINALENFIKSLKTDGEWILNLEDDFIFCNNFFQKIEKIIEMTTNKMRVVGIFLNYKEGLKKKNFYSLPAEKFYTATFLIRKEDARDLIKYLEKKLEEGRDTLMDIYLQKWHAIKYPKKPIYLSSWGLCRHIGLRSTIIKKNKTKSFTREGFPNYENS